LFQPEDSATALDWEVPPTRTFVERVQAEITQAYEAKENKRRQKEHAENMKPWEGHGK
jgi:hypothetical protein